MRVATAVRRFWPWVLIPCALFGGLEAYARATVARVPTGYRAAERIAARKKVGAVFIGSSRTQAAIIPRVFDAALAMGGARRGRTLNMARGYTTDAEHYLGLRRLLSVRPDHTSGVVVFVELGTTVPWQVRWETQPWAAEQAPELLADVMDFRDLPSFWRSRGLGLEMRAHVTLQMLLRPFASISRRVRLRQHLGRRIVPALTRNDPGPDLQLGADLQGPGPASSIRTDTEAVLRARAQARETAAQQLKYQAPIRDWAGTVQEDIVRLVHAHGGRVVFFQVPVHPMFAEGYRTPIRQADAAAFAEQARRWGVCVVRPPFPVGDEDFPDTWHLHPVRAPAFSEVLAQAWLAECR